MKRSPLKRRTALKSGGYLRRKPAEAIPNSVFRASSLWHETTRARGCEVCFRRGQICEGPLQCHHVVPAQTLKRRGLRHLLWDDRNGMGACYRAHRRHTNGVEPIERSLLRPETEAFAAEHGLTDVLDRLYG